MACIAMVLEDSSHRPFIVCRVIRTDNDTRPIAFEALRLVHDLDCEIAIALSVPDISHRSPMSCIAEDPERSLSSIWQVRTFKQAPIHDEPIFSIVAEALIARNWLRTKPYDFGIWVYRYVRVAFVTQRLFENIE